MATVTEKIRELQGAAQSLDRVVGQELPEAKLYPAQAMYDIWQGLGQMRMDMLHIAHAVRQRFPGDQWSAIYAEWDAAFRPLAQYSAPINNAREEGALNVVLADYFFKQRLRAYLQLMVRVLAKVRAIGDAIATVLSGTGWLEGILKGIVKVYKGIKAVVGGAINIAKDLFSGLGFLAANWMFIAAGLGYWWWTSRKSARSVK